MLRSRGKAPPKKEQTEPGNMDLLQEEWFRFEAFISDLLAGFLHVPDARIDAEISDAIRRIAECLGLDQGLLIQWGDDEARPCPTHFWTVPWGLPPPLSPGTEVVPWAHRQSILGKIVMFSRVDDLPQEAEKDKEFFRASGRKSLISLPLKIDGSVVGVLIFATLGAEIIWSDEVVRRLRMVTDVFAGLLDRKKRKQQLENRLRFESLLADLSARFVNIASDQVDGEIEAAQKLVCEHLGLDLSSLWQWSDETPKKLILTHLYRVMEGPPPPEAADARELFPWTTEQVITGKTVAVSSTEKVPAKAFRDREVWRHYRVKTSLGIPLSAGGGPIIGVLSFNDMRRERDWSESIVARLQLVAGIFANAIVRKRSDKALRQSEERLNLAADSAGAIVWGLELDSGRIWTREKDKEFFGFAQDSEMDLASFLEIVHPEDRENLRRTVEETVRTGRDNSAEYRILRPDGRVRWVLSMGRPYPSGEGRPANMMGVSIDITERKRAEKKLEDRLRFEKLLTTISTQFINISIDSLDDEISAAQRQICQWLGLDISALWQFSPAHPENLFLTHYYVPPDFPIEVPRAMKASKSFPWCLEKLMNKERIVLSRLSEAPSSAARDRDWWKYFGIKSVLTYPLYAGGGPVFGALNFNVINAEQEWPEELVIMLQMVAEIFANALNRKYIERNLIESEARLASAIDVAKLGFYEMNENYRIIFGDDRMRALLGITVEDEPQGREFWLAHIHPDDLPRILDLSRNVLEGGVDRFATEYRYVHPQRGLTWLHHLSHVLARDAAGRAVRVIGAMQDISDRKGTEEELLTEKNKLQSVLSAMNSGVTIRNMDYELVYQNEYSLNMFGNHLGAKCYRVFAGIDSVCEDCPVEKALRDGKSHSHVKRVEMLPGVITFWENVAVPMRDSNGNICACLEINNNVTERKQAEEEVQESEQRLRDIIFSMADWVWEVDHNGVYTYSSPKGDELFGKVIGRTPFDFMPPDEAKRVAAIFSDIAANKAPIKDLENWNIGKNGERICLLTNGVPILDGEGQLKGYRGVDKDITERKRAENALRESEERYRGVVETQAEMICRFLPDTTLLFVNEAYKRYYGRPGEALIGSQFLLNVPVEQHGDLLRYLASFSPGSRIMTSEREVVLPDGKRRWQEWTDQAFFTEDGQIAGFQSVGRDIMQRKEAEEALKKSEAALRTSEQDLQKLAGKLISAQEEELRRLSRELHDDLTQRLAVIAIEAGKLEVDLRKTPGARPEISQKISLIKNQLIGVSQDVHVLSRQLHPAILDDLGLVRAIESECAMLPNGDNIEIIFMDEDVPAALSKDVALCIYRVFQEGLRNVIAHSRATKCEIFLRGSEGTLSLDVADNGVGFDPAEVRRKPGLGLSSMRERAQIVQGDFSIKSQPGQGTVIHVNVSLKGGGA